MVRVLFIITFLCCITCLYGQNRAAVTISATKSYSDHIEVAENSSDNSIITKFTFNEDENSITISLISYSPLFMFWSDTEYKSVISMHRLCTNKLPFATESGNSIFVVDKAFRRQVASTYQPMKHYIFKRSLIVEGADAKELPLTIVNDIIEQKFFIKDSTDRVTVTLGDIATLERRSNKKSKYYLAIFKSLDKIYDIDILRDPCFKREAEVEQTANRVAAIEEAYSSLLKFKDQAEKDNLKESIELFNKLQAISIKDNPRVEKSDRCEAIDNLITRYNSYADSISQMKVVIKSQEIKETIDPSYILTQLQILDTHMSLMQYTDDVMQKFDERDACQEIITSLQDYIHGQYIISEKARLAVNLFHQAESIFGKLKDSEVE